MKTIEFRLKGIRPLMIHAENPFENGNGKAGPTKRSPSPQEQAEHHLHKAKINGKEVAVVPGINLQKSVQAAYSYMPGRKLGWKKFTKTITVETPFMPIEPQNWTLDARRPMGAGGRGSGTMLYRPRFDEWSIKGEAQYDERFVSEEEVRMFFDNAGAYVGLGSWRVGNGGPYGKFTVTEWKEI